MLNPGNCSPFETPKCMSQFPFLLASSHHHPPMNFYYSFFLLLVVLSAYSEGPQHAKPPDPTMVAVCPNSSSVSLGVLTPILPQNEVFRTVPPQNGVFENITVKRQLFDSVKTVMYSLSNVGVKGISISTSTLIHGAEIFGWTIRIILECFLHVFEMYSWSLSENQASVQLRCRLTALFLKQSCFRKHDFVVYVHNVYYSSGCLCFWNWKIFSDHKNHPSDTQIGKEHAGKSYTNYFHGGGEPLIFSSDELLPYVSADLHDQQYQFQRCIKTDDKQHSDFVDDEVICNVPLDVLAPKLTINCIKKVSTLHDMFMPSKILLKNAQLLLQDHKCECGEFLSVFKPHKVASNTERQQTWYRNHKDKRAEYNKCPAYRESHKKSSQKCYQTNKDVKFPPDPPSAELCRNIISDFCADTSPEVFEETGCAVCGKLAPICEMEELYEVENISLLKVDGVTRKARYESSDPVEELRGPILAPGCSKVCPICVESLEKKKMPASALANGLWVGDIPDELRHLTYQEHLLIARVGHNRCIVKVSSGMSKMRANAISFSNP